MEEFVKPSLGKSPTTTPVLSVKECGKQPDSRCANEQLPFDVEEEQVDAEYREGAQPFDPDRPQSDPEEGRADTTRRATFVDPVIEYPRSRGRCVTGGRVYHGESLSELKGAYLFADFASGNVWAIHRKGEQPQQMVQLADTDLAIAGDAVLLRSNCAGVLIDSDSHGMFELR